MVIESAYKNHTSTFREIETNISPQHNSAAVRLFIEGLSIMCLNRRKERIEVAFIKDGHSPVNIEIFEDKENGSCEQIDRFTCPADKTVEIKIEKSNPDGPGKVYYEPDGSVTEGFNCMPDLEVIHNKKIQVLGNCKPALSGKLLVKDATFYTKFVSAYDACVTYPDQRICTSQKIGRILGADIFCGPRDDTVDLSVVVDDFWVFDYEIFAKKLPKSRGPHAIWMWTHPHHEDNDPLPNMYRNILGMSNGISITYDDDEPHWAHCQYVGNKTTRLFYLSKSALASGINEDERKYFATYTEAVAEGYAAAMGTPGRSTQFACQTFGGGEGPLPNFP